MKLKKLLASILCVAMVLSTMGTVTFANETTVATVNDAPFTSLADALNAASAVDGAVTVELKADVEWVTGGGHGSTPFVPEESTAIVTINGNDYTITATGAGVGPIRAANDTLLTFKDVNFVDESVSYNESAWEFTYLEFAGKLKFANCDFKDEITLDSESADFENCTFESNEESVYAVWVSNGTVTFTDNCYFTGYRGLKMHEDYGSDIVSATIEDCKFENITKKPGIAIGDLNDTTSVEISDCEFINVQAGEQGSYIFETDTDVSTFTFESEENKVINGSITPGYTNNTSIWGEGGANAKESFVVELYAEEEKIGQASLNDYEDIIDGDLYVTWNINFAGEDSEYWTVDWYGNNPSVDTIPTKVVLVVDGVKVAENIVKMCTPDDLNHVEWDELTGIPAAATMGEKRFATIQDAVDAVVEGDNEIIILPGTYAESFRVTQKEGINITIKAENLGDVTLTGKVTIDGNKRGKQAETLDFENLTFDGSTKTSSTVYLIEEVNGKDAHNVTITNCNFYDDDENANNVIGYKGGKVGPKAAYNITFESCTAEGLFALAQFNNAGKLTVNNCTVTGKNGVQTRVTPEIIFTNNTFNVSGYAVYAGQQTTGNKVDSEPTITFVGNNVESGSAAISLQNTAATVEAQNNTVNSEVGLFRNNNSDDTTINGIAITDEEVIERVGKDNVIIPTELEISFEKATDADGKEIDGLYNIVLDGEDDIYEFVAAELTFANTSKTVANEDMNYEILGVDSKINVEKNIEKADTYALRLVDGAERMSGRDLVIGQVKFFGQGDINFTVSEGKVVTTEYGTNLGQYYTLDADDTTADTLTVDAITNGAVEEVTRTVVVNVAYKHALDGTYWNDNQITVTLKDGFGNSYGPFDVSDKIETIPNVKLGRLTVTLEAPGFRKYVYNTTLEAGADENDALVLNFWNDIKRNTVQSPLAEIEAGVSGETDKNFVVGDIVMDYTVDEYDLAAVTSYYGMYELTDADKYIKYDLNRDGNIDIIDVHYVLHTLNN